MFKLLASIFIFAIMLINSNGGVANELSITTGIALIAAGLDTIFYKISKDTENLRVFCLCFIE